MYNYNIEHLYFDDLPTQRTGMNLINMDKFYRKLCKTFERDVVFISINRLDGKRDVETILERRCDKVITIDKPPGWQDKEIESIYSKTHDVYPVHCRCHNLIDRIDEIL